MKFTMTVAEKENNIFALSKLVEKTKNWSKDHWSLLAYFETRCVDHKGVPDLTRMRVNSTKRGFTNGSNCTTQWQPTWGTVYKDGSVSVDHDDFDILEELENLGFVENIGTGLNPLIRMTNLGTKTCNAIRLHKTQEKSNFKNFNFETVK